MIPVAFREILKFRIISLIHSQKDSAFLMDFYILRMDHEIAIPA